MRKALFILLGAFLVVTNRADASDVVLLDEGRGQGLLFHYGQDCFLILPAHVHGDSYSVRFQGVEPQQSGRATISNARVDELDLSLASIRNSSNMDCGTAWFDLTKDINVPVPSALTLTRVEGANVQTSTPLHVTTETSTRIETRIAPGYEDFAMFQGTSGATAFSGPRPVGMAIEAKSETEASLLRMSRILNAIAAIKGYSLTEPRSIMFESDIAPVGSPQLPKEAPLTGVYTVPQDTFEPMTIKGNLNDGTDAGN